MSQADDEAIKIARDVRVDTVGFAAELQRQLANDLKTGIKASMLDKGVLRVEGDYFDGLLISGTRSTIDAEKFFRLLTEGQITQEQFLSSISIAGAPAGKFLSEQRLAEISRTEETISLRIDRKKGIQVELKQALAALAKAAKRRV